ncbi:hypothetical protein D0N36_18220 [Hymenobacter lapidiphilus]|uniref:hypothetical protein n=1 Tax=Hymenobacter sp. CCM 8763 TaxID=2303334 RepID=UPI000E347F65|nr:hypothetical protein [Hymenobacter sp. CCM 8763]RFP63689.1 hypothetical protein D0N36_18220 [Hymenobacter sp. CCM 8763]
MKRFLFLALAALALTLGSCDEKECCVQPPKSPITAAALTQTSTWYLGEYTAAGQTTRADAIKDRFALRFAADGSYRRVLLSDNSETAGTWKLSDPDNRQLNLIDHKGDPQNFTVESASTETLYLYRPDKAGQPETYLFKTVR